MRNDLVLAPLFIQMQTGKTELLERKFREFRCVRDIDIEQFIREKAIPWERSGISRTYLYLGGSDDKVELIAYISVAITSVDFSGISRSRRKKVLGGKPGRDNHAHFPGLLIGQLARDDRFDSSVIDGATMIADAESLIETGRQSVGGTLIYLDCKEDLVGFYECNGYRLLANSEPADGLFKMFKPLPKLDYPE